MMDPAKPAAGDTEVTRRHLVESALIQDAEARRHAEHVQQLQDEINITKQRMDHANYKAACFRRDAHALALI